MALSVVTSIQIEGTLGDTLTKAAATLRNPRKFMRQVGVLGMSSASARLNANLRMDRSLRSGALFSSLNVSESGAGSANTVFELSDNEVTIGTNLPYAAQVQFGGTIVPKPPNKALAIPLPNSLKQAKRWPLDLDPNRELLQFVPYRGGKPNILGFLVDPGDEIKLRNKRGKLKSRNVSRTGYGPGPLFMLVRSVTQTPNPYLFWSDADRALIENDLWPKFLGL